MFCKKCGKEIAQGANACSGCGAVVAVQNINEQIIGTNGIDQNENIVVKKTAGVVLGKNTFNFCLITGFIAIIIALFLYIMAMLNGGNYYGVVDGDFFKTINFFCSILILIFASIAFTLGLKDKLRYNYTAVMPAVLFALSFTYFMFSLAFLIRAFAY